MVDPKSQISFIEIFLCSAFASCFAVLYNSVEYGLTSEFGNVTKYRGLLGALATIAREEGLTALGKGITPGLYRQLIYGGLRFGLYEPVKRIFVSESEVYYD